ncbi:tyrosine-protein kinase STYK1-like isoform X1 [Poecilia latipinna]|uniref:Tyrosine-protein kinase STYK1-like n=1 Tax=Poecilia formosa TaxID=48698 RepID=A0A087XR73_POEFO|nr:PREDICTED: tyrosine-protein kinase STYK1-like isoform X1 [Poecilia formosa]XP_014895693.1 PREDICTED: tyrosine-protein kinase STYK1-like isoform X1 [Poecilia latipinna]XP_014895694.1 PREDICTED: tyrosine-protein kinase STYK1-like isoform X1 [Poecilia latipinna]XP_016533066.1 PREDICTED: tyrosine-protein kinase STYK1-like isoform X1 [Poecilia formosa]
MTTNYTDISPCAPDDRLCLTREYQLGVIVVPSLLVSLTLITLLIIFILLFCNQSERTRVRTPTRYHNHQHTTNQRHTQRNHHHHHDNNRHPHHRHHLQGIDAPPGIDPLEHEDVPMRVQNTHHNAKPQHESPERHGTAAPHRTRDRHAAATRHRSPERHATRHRSPERHATRHRSPERHATRHHSPERHATRHHSPERQVTAEPQTSTRRPLGNFSDVTALTPSFYTKPNDTVSFYRARMDNKDVILRALKENASNREKQHFLGFASFLGGLGPHPFIPALLGVVSVRSPLVIVLEELRHRDLLGFLWKCREDNTSHELTEKRIFTMAGQVASALDYLHSQGSIHGNIGARSVLVGGDLTAKLWGLGPAYHRTQVDTAGLVEEMELKKWQAPEVLARRTASNSSDVWSFGVLLYEMVSLGDPPFAHIMSTELLQYLQRGKTLKRPTNCSNTLYSMMKSCCSWSPQGRPSVTGLIRMLHTGEQSANGSTALRAPEPLNLERYMREAGYGEALNYAVF